MNIEDAQFAFRFVCTIYEDEHTEIGEQLVEIISNLARLIETSDPSSVVDIVSDAQAGVYNVGMIRLGQMQLRKRHGDYTELRDESVRAQGGQ